VNRDELDTLIRVHQAALYRYARYLGSEPADAEDLVQETFLVACRKGQVPEDVNAAAAWLRGVLRNRFLEFCRHRGRDPALLDAEGLEACEHFFQDRFLRDGDGFEYLQALQECLEQLPARQREAIDMRYWQRAGRAEMAQRLGIGEDGVKMLLRRIREALAKCVSGKLEVGTS
jgi:RNA polymerase sigma-70 factor (ECF subfamily)